MQWVVGIRNILGISLSLWLGAHTVHASEFISILDIPGVNPGSTSGSEYVELLYILAISFAALLAVGQLVIAGFQYVTSDIVTNKEEAKRRIRAAIVGLLIILAAVVILRTINPAIANLPALQAPPLPEPTFGGGRGVPVSGDDTIDDTAEDLSCPTGYVVVRTVNGYECQTTEERGDSVVVTGENADTMAFDTLPLDESAWIDARENDPRLQQYTVDEVVGYLEVKLPESQELLADYSYDNSLLRQQYMEPLCQRNGGSKVYTVERLSTRTGFYCVRD